MPGPRKSGQVDDAELSPDARRMARLLRYASYAEIGRALGVGRQAVFKWANGENVGAWQLHQVERLYERTFGPIGAAALSDRESRVYLHAIAQRIGVTDDDLEVAEAEVVAAELIPDAGEPQSRPRADAAVSRGRRGRAGTAQL